MGEELTGKREGVTEGYGHPRVGIEARARLETVRTV